MGKQVIAFLTKESDTPGTRKFLEPEPDDGTGKKIRNMYVVKAAVAELGNPDKIKVTIEAVE